MRPRNLIFAGAIIGCLIVAAVLFAIRPTAGEFDARATRHINKLCGTRSDCQVYLIDLTKDEWNTSVSWDTYYEFGPGTSNEAISKTIGAPFSKDHDLRRVTVLMRGRTVVYSDIADEGIEMPLAGEVTLSCKPFSGSFTACPSNALFKVKKVPTQGDRARLLSRSGTAYILTQIN
jgi:hypothetical protein